MSSSLNRKPTYTIMKPQSHLSKKHRQNREPDTTTGAPSRELINLKVA